MSMQKEYLMLSLIVPRMNQVRDTDIYLEPLINEVFILWSGI
jgi:hypothetical protein